MPRRNSNMGTGFFLFYQQVFVRARREGSQFDSRYARVEAKDWEGSQEEEYGRVDGSFVLILNHCPSFPPFFPLATPSSSLEQTRSSHSPRFRIRADPRPRRSLISSREKQGPRCGPSSDDATADSSWLMTWFERLVLDKGSRTDFTREMIVCGTRMGVVSELLLFWFEFRIFG